MICLNNFIWCPHEEILYDVSLFLIEYSIQILIKNMHKEKKDKLNNTSSFDFYKTL